MIEPAFNKVENIGKGNNTGYQIFDPLLKSF